MIIVHIINTHCGYIVPIMHHRGNEQKIKPRRRRRLRPKNDG